MTAEPKWLWNGERYCQLNARYRPLGTSPSRSPQTVPPPSDGDIWMWLGQRYTRVDRNFRPVDVPAASQPQPADPPLLPLPPLPKKRIWKNLAELASEQHADLTKYARGLLAKYGVSDSCGYAEDLVQEAWCELHPRWDAVHDPRGWMYAVVKNKAARASGKLHETLDAAHVESRQSRPLWTSLPPTASVEQKVEAREAIQAIAGLPGQQRTAAYLRYVEGREYADIAARLNVTSGTAGVHLNRANRRLRDLLKIVGSFILVLMAAVGWAAQVINAHRSTSGNGNGGTGGYPGGPFPAPAVRPPFTVWSWLEAHWALALVLASLAIAILILLWMATVGVVRLVSRLSLRTARALRRLVHRLIRSERARRLRALMAKVLRRAATRRWLGIRIRLRR